MSVDKVPGTYIIIKTQDYVDFMIKAGAPKEISHKCLGVKVNMRLEQYQGKWVVTSTCPEMPSLGYFGTFTEGVEEECDHPWLGGKIKSFFKLTAPNTFRSKMISDTCGTSIIDEIYSDEGIQMTTVHKETGATLKESWTREIHEDGWYKFVKDTNMSNFNKAVGLPADYEGIKKMHWSKLGNFCQMSEFFGDTPIKSSFTLDEEYTYKWTEDAKLDRTILVTQLGVGKYLFLCKGAQGQLEEWKASFSEDELLWEGLDKKSGQSCKIWMTKQPNIFGQFRQIATAGYDEFGAAMGMPADVVAKLKNDFTATLSMEEIAGMIRCKYDSKVMPLDLTYKFDEEYDFVFPGTSDVYKVVETLHGNTIMAVAKGKNFVQRSETKFTNNFAIMVAEILGSGIKSKVVYERI